MNSLITIFIFVAVTSAVFGIPQGKAQSPSSQGNALTRSNFVCPEEVGDFADPRQCDKYWRCSHGVGSPHLCDDGLVFDPSKPDGVEDPCDSPYVVNCDGKEELQEPTYASEYCPRRHGFFSDPDPGVCNVFYTCKNGLKTKVACTTGLHFDEITGTCAWPHDAKREGCAAAVQPSVNGFSCPFEEVLNAQNQKIPHPSYPNLEDCQKFYVCLNGLTPQQAACELGKVFSESSMLCDYPENVPECEGWYRNDPRFSDFYADNPPKSSDPGLVDVVG